MREPSLQMLFHTMANPLQTREGQDNHELHATQVRTRCYEDFACAFNDMMLVPHYAVDVSAWCDVQIDVSRPPEQRDWIRVAESMQKLKTRMSVLLKRFQQSGDCENGSDNMRRDQIFWSKFSNGDPVAFYAYMCWDHGKAVPAWNSCLLPKDMQLELGGSDKEAASDDDGAPVRKRSKTTALSELVSNTNKFFQAALQSQQSQSSQSTASLPESARATELSAVTSQIAQVETLLSNPRIPAPVAEALATNLGDLYQKVVSLTTTTRQA